MATVRTPKKSKKLSDKTMSDEEVVKGEQASQARHLLDATFKASAMGKTRSATAKKPRAIPKNT